MKAFQAPYERATGAFLLHLLSILILIGFFKKDQYKSAQYTLNRYTLANITGPTRKRHYDFLSDHADDALQRRNPVFRQLGLRA